MRVKNRILYSVICTMLFVMTFTTLTAFAADGDIVNKTYIGTYYNVDNDNSYFTIKNDSTYPITAITVYDGTRGVWFRGSGEMVTINSREFAADFSAPYKVNEQGIIQGTNPLKGITIVGKVSSNLVWFKTVVTVKMTPDGKQYEKN